MTGPFRALWATATSANLGDGVALTALPLIALSVSASASEVALVTTVATAAWPLFGLHAGWVVDRVQTGRLLLPVNLARAAALLILAGAIATQVSVMPAVYAAALIYGVAETLVDTAVNAAVPRLVPAATLTSANSRLHATSTMLNSFIGPPLAGLLVGTSTVVAAATGSALYTLAALSALFLLRSLDQPGHQRESHADDHGRVRDGLAFLWRHVLLRQLAILTAVMNLVWGAWTALFVMYAIAPGPLNLNPVGYGGLITAMSVGGIAAGIATPLLRRVFSVPTLLFADLVGTVLLVLPAAMGGPLWTVVAGIVAAGAGASLWSVLVAVLRQERTPPALLGRVYSASRVLSWGALPLGSALAAFLAHWLDVGQILGAAAVLAIMTAAWFPLLRINRHIAAEDTQVSLKEQGRPLPDFSNSPDPDAQV